MTAVTDTPPLPDTPTGAADPVALLDEAWCVIANAYGGNWSAAEPRWRAAATRWRNSWHVHTGSRDRTEGSRGPEVTPEGINGLSMDARRALAAEIRELTDYRGLDSGINGYMARHAFTGPCQTCRACAECNLDPRLLLRALADDLELAGLPEEPPEGTVLRTVDGKHLWMRRDDADYDRRGPTGEYPYLGWRWYSTAGAGPISWLHLHGLGLRAPSNVQPGLAPDLTRPVQLGATPAGPE